MFTLRICTHFCQEKIWRGDPQRPAPVEPILTEYITAISMPIALWHFLFN
jgi:hypothetical protein